MSIRSREFRAILFKCLFSTNEIQMFMDMELATARNSEEASDSVFQVFFEWKSPQWATHNTMLTLQACYNMNDFQKTPMSNYFCTGTRIVSGLIEQKRWTQSQDLFQFILQEHLLESDPWRPNLQPKCSC